MKYNVPYEIFETKKNSAFKFFCFTFLRYEVEELYQVKI